MDGTGTTFDMISIIGQLRTFCRQIACALKHQFGRKVVKGTPPTWMLHSLNSLSPSIIVLHPSLHASLSSFSSFRRGRAKGRSRLIVLSLFPELLMLLLLVLMHFSALHLLHSFVVSRVVMPFTGFLFFCCLPLLLFGARSRRVLCERLACEGYPKRAHSISSISFAR